MDSRRYTMAADILTALRDKEDGYTGVPDVPLVREYENEITTACRAASPKMLATGTASLIYLSDERFGHRP